jgi:hypothetical protein
MTRRKPDPDDDSSIGFDHPEEQAKDAVRDAWNRVERALPGDAGVLAARRGARA